MLADILKNARINQDTLYDLIAENGEVDKHINILVNGRDIKEIDGLKTKVRNGDTIYICSSLSTGGMVDITSKSFSYRVAEAEGYIKLSKSSIDLIKNNRVEKGNIYEAVKLSVINAVKNTPNILLYCHPIKITSIKVDMKIYDENVKVSVTVKSIEQTGVEMEALTGVMTGLLTIWDMVKKYEKDDSGNYPHTLIYNVRVVKKEKKMYE